MKEPKRKGVVWRCQGDSFVSGDPLPSWDAKAPRQRLCRPPYSAVAGDRPLPYPPAWWPGGLH